MEGGVVDVNDIEDGDRNGSYGIHDDNDGGCSSKAGKCSMFSADDIQRTTLKTNFSSN